MSIHHSFAGKRVLVTGGGQGIGRKLVERFHGVGASVFTIDKNPDAVQKLKKDFPGVKGEIVDLTDWEETRRVVESFGVIDHLVNNAGVVMCQRFMDITKESTNLIFEVNVGAVINVTQVVAKGLIDSGREGSVVNVSSITARQGSLAGSGVYSASKAALENLTKTMALELGAHKIRVNCILPGLVDTPMLKESKVAVDPWVVQRRETRPVIKRPVDTDEIADLVIFLLSPLASMIVGEGVVIDGGLLTN